MSRLVLCVTLEITHQQTSMKIDDDDPDDDEYERCFSNTLNTFQQPLNSQIDLRET